MLKDILLGDYNKITIDFLKSIGSVPRLHGNGFIQLDLTKNDRLHIYHPELRKLAQTTRTSIHDHMFNFTSTILIGKLKHTIYEIEENPMGLYNVYVAVPKENEETELISDGKKVTVISTEYYEMAAGSKYMFPALKFHESDADELTATIIDKIHRKQGYPRVLCFCNEKPDNKFQKHSVSEDVLWEYIEYAMNKFALIS